MTLYQQLLESLPELTQKDFEPRTGTISLRDDSDGLGAYIEKWEFSKPLPDGMKVGK